MRTLHLSAALAAAALAFVASSDLSTGPPTTYVGAEHTGLTAALVVVASKPIIGTEQGIITAALGGGSANVLADKHAIGDQGSSGVKPEDGDGGIVAQGGFGGITGRYSGAKPYPLPASGPRYGLT